MLSDVVELLACPNCHAALALLDQVVLCSHGHAFDVARQGYVSLATGAAGRISGDTAEMIAARAAFLDAGHFDPIADAVADVVAYSGEAARILEIGAGTGHYLHQAVAVDPGSVGLGIDISKAAARRIARIHPAVGAVVADAWQRLPVLDGSITHAMSIFAPRNAAEVRRVLEPDGVYIVVTPTPRHLRELVQPLGMVRVDDDKTRRLADALSGRFERVGRAVVEFEMALDTDAIEAVVGMGPTAFHTTPNERARLVAALPPQTAVTASVVVATYRPRRAMTSE